MVRWRDVLLWIAGIISVWLLAHHAISASYLSLTPQPRNDKQQHNHQLFSHHTHFPIHASPLDSLLHSSLSSSSSSSSSSPDSSFDLSASSSSPASSSSSSLSSSSSFARPSLLEWSQSINATLIIHSASSSSSSSSSSSDSLEFQCARLYSRHEDKSPGASSSHESRGDSRHPDDTNGVHHRRDSRASRSIRYDPYYLSLTNVPPIVIVNEERARRAHQMKLVNGVILFVITEASLHELFSALYLLDHFFLHCWPYPVHFIADESTIPFFHSSSSSSSSPEALSCIETLLSHASSITIEFVCFDSCVPSSVPSFDAAVQWLQHLKYGWVGYANMCRFYSGTLYTWPSLLQYDYYLRHDTDSFYTKPIVVDPFRVAQEQHCHYVYESMDPDHPDVVKFLYNTTETILQHFVKQQQQQPQDERELIAQDEKSSTPFSYSAALQRVRSFVLDDGKSAASYNRRIFNTHFELSALAPFRARAYQSVFHDWDTSLGFFKYRWGDAPIRGLAVPMMMTAEHVCWLSKHVEGVVHKDLDPTHLVLKARDCTNEIEQDARKSNEQLQQEWNHANLNKCSCHRNKFMLPEERAQLFKTYPLLPKPLY